jgi:adenylate cyclase
VGLVSAIGDGLTSEDGARCEGNSVIRHNEEGRMGFEIERKFLVSDDSWKASVERRIQIRQAYLASEGKASVRVRIRGNHDATLTFKSRGATLRRLELEYPIPVLDAEALISLRHGSVIEKERHIVLFEGGTWEIDVFAGENSGLVIGEVELQNEAQRVELPPWIGAEITGRSEYYNGSLALHPFQLWHSHLGSRTV